ncbi:MAG: ATP-binding response regulator [Mesonia hippocampi]|uniref:hybrid sensor histidine kinase/response regulator n=1 Tax=Mesonia hippocampi TaxID=1628250 RepID=UPI003F9C8B8F
MAQNTKRSIEFKALAGFLLLTAFAIITIWFVYSKFASLTQANQEGAINNKRLMLISQTVANMYTVEGISRDIIQKQDTKRLPEFKTHLDSTELLLEQLKQTYTINNKTTTELDSIKNLLLVKEQNLVELLELRKKNLSNNYYDRVLNRLEQLNSIFEDDNYEQRLRKLPPHIKKVMIKYLEYAKEDNAQRLTQQSADSLINAMKKVLIDLESEEKHYQNTVYKKELTLLENDRIVSHQLRKLHAEIEHEEVQKSVAQVAESQELLKNTFYIIISLGVVSFLTIILFVYLIIKDTNRSQRYRIQVEKAKNYAEFLLKRREQFMAMVTHDLRSPLNTVLGYADLLNNSELTQQQTHYLNKLQKASAYILRLVNDLLDLSKLEAGKLIIEELPFAPKTLIEDCIINAVPSNNPKKLKINTHIDAQLENPLLSDPFRIKQILTNLIGNAYKFTQQGSITITANLDTFSLNSNWLVVEIADTGIGINAAEKEHIFNEFSQLQKQYEGSGLGLTITKKLVDLLNGKIEVESTSGKGSVFSVRIPVSHTKHLPITPNNKQITITGNKGYHIFLIDDDPTQLNLTKTIIEQAGFTCTTSRAPKEALKQISQHEYHLIITDIQMPGLNGFELIREIKLQKSLKEIPIIAISGRTEVDDKIYTDYGFTAKLDKPFQKSDLLETIAVTLNLTYSITNKDVLKHKNEETLYDLTQLHIFTDNDKESLVLLLNTFVDNTKINISILEKSITKKDFNTIAFTAHKILPMLKQIKASSAIELINTLERQRELNLTEKKIIATTQKAIKELKKLLQSLEERT